MKRVNRIKEFLHDRRARKLGLTNMQINGGDCARCGKPFGAEGRFPSLYSPVPGMRVYACYGGCGVKGASATVWTAEGDEINARIHSADWVAALPVYDSMDALLSDLEMASDEEPACSCGGDPETCPANQAVAAEIAAGNEDGAR